MIRKPPAALLRESPLVDAARTLHATAATGVTVARAGSLYLQGLVCWGFALPWGFAALASGASGQVPTFLGAGAMALGAAFFGRRCFAQAARCRAAPGTRGVHA